LCAPKDIGSWNVLFVCVCVYFYGSYDNPEVHVRFVGRVCPEV